MNNHTTRLLTLLNVSAVKAGKRKRPYEQEVSTREKLNKRSKNEPANANIDQKTNLEPNADEDEGEGETDEEEERPEDGTEAEELEETRSDPYEEHFGPHPGYLTASAREAVDHSVWTSRRVNHGKLGSLVVSHPEGAASAIGSDKHICLLERLQKPFAARQQKISKEQRQIQNDILSSLSLYNDLFISRTSLDTQSETREAVALHALNHVMKKRRRVLKNNERIAHHAKARPNDPPLEDVQDQGFTRPSVLVLLPFRNSAQAWVRALTVHTPSPDFQVEHRARFEREFGLPEGAVDKLLSAEPGTYPADHVSTFAGNVDDSFRIGVKMTRKSVKLFSEFYGSDIIIASPLGLRMSMEKEKNSDFLSSIELLIVDQLDALTMQNWDHVQYVFSQLNQMPKESHDTDFSRVKPWYLEGHSAYLRQTIMLSAYETPEIRNLFNRSLKNVSGKLRTERRWSPLTVPDGINQEFVQFDCAGPADEVEKRFDYFTKQLLPSVLKSAVLSANTVIMVPSSFDFIRVQNYLRKDSGISFTVLSEYSSNQEISRARQAFFSGKKSFLLITERFHFFRRYKLRGIRNLIFYALPEHAQFYSEFLSYPFLDEGVEPSDVTCRVLYSRFDWFRLERIAGTEAAAELVKRGGA